jgi:hypothetical protein
MKARIEAAYSAIALLERPDLREPWEGVLLRLAERADVHGLVVGRAARLVLDAGLLEPAEAARRLALALSPGADPAQAAAWIEGFLSGSALVLLHDEALLGVVDGWLRDVGDDAFTRALPVLRRTFATFSPPERRQLGERVRGGVRASAAGLADAELDHERAALVLPVLRRILGVPE